MFRFGYGYCDNRLMDEKFIFEGKSIELKNELIDNNLKSFSWWLEKHNRYANKEVVELLDKKFKFLKRNKLKNSENYIINRSQLNNYYRFPIFVRAFVYFLYRYILRLGFLDGYEGFLFHFFQGFIYRLVIDIKYKQLLKEIRVSKKNYRNIILFYLDIDIG